MFGKFSVTQNTQHFFKSTYCTWVDLMSLPHFHHHIAQTLLEPLFLSEPECSDLLKRSLPSGKNAPGFNSNEQNAEYVKASLNISYNLVQMFPWEKQHLFTVCFIFCYCVMFRCVLWCMRVAVLLVLCLYVEACLWKCCALFAVNPC